MGKSKNRFIIMVVVGIIVSLLLNLLIPFETQNHNKLYDILTSIFITILLWEGNLQIDMVMGKYFPWINGPGKRIAIHSLVSLVFSVLGIVLPMMFFSKYLCVLPETYKTVLLQASIIIGIMVTFIILSIETGIQFFAQWKLSLVEVERYKSESIQAQLQNLKDQVNPHFLFNNLSVLSSLVYKDQDKAVEFIEQLSKVYRYLLETKSAELIPLEDELKFIESYTYLLKIRFDNSIRFSFKINEENLKLLVPPMAIQILIENAIKHNEISEAFPLSVELNCEDNYLEVKNNFQPRHVDSSSSKTGLKNIKDRYAFYTNKPVAIFNNSQVFSVKIPLLNTK